MSIEERALEKYPVKIVNYDEFSMFDMNENKRQRYIEICKEQDAITRKETLDKAWRWLFLNADSYDRGNGYHLDDMLEDFLEHMGD